MLELNVTVHLVEDETAPYQLEATIGKDVILDYVDDFKKAPEAILESIEELRESYSDEEMPEELKETQFEFDFRHDVQSVLNMYRGVLSQASIARMAGLNKSLFSQYISVNQPKEFSVKQLIKIQTALNNLGKELIELKFDYGHEEKKLSL